MTPPNHSLSTVRELPVTAVRVSDRHRKDMGDLAALAESILQRATIPARIVDVPSILADKYAENEVRKDFTPSERVAGS